MNLPPINYIDAYKIGHIEQYEPGTRLIHSNFTARKSRDGFSHHVVFGLRYFLRKYLEDEFRQNFFSMPKGWVCSEYKRRVEGVLGMKVDVSHIGGLHDLGFLPLHIRSLPEGALCPIGVPCLTIENTNPSMFWLVNYLETLMSTTLWGPMTSATKAFYLRQLLEHHAGMTSDNPEAVHFQAHDFSMRGMFGLEAACMSGAGHLLSFRGTDSIPAIDFLEEYYFAENSEVIGMSVPATEHSVMCIGKPEGEQATFERLLDLYPTGILSVVSDSWDYWRVLDEYLPRMKDQIVNRHAGDPMTKLVIRPDSGDPQDIIMRSLPKLEATFGSSVNSKGYKDLHPAIGLIYGDSINFERADSIMKVMAEAGWASTNVVFGVGSYTYQYNTRDTLGFAMKATAGIVGDEERPIFKDPVTDDGTKRSARGFLSVLTDGDGDYRLRESETQAGATGGNCLMTAFRNGRTDWWMPLRNIRQKLWGPTEPMA